MSRTKRSFLAVWAALALAVGAGRAAAAEAGFSRTEPVDVQADRMEYEGQGNYLIGIGNVVVRQGGQELRADYVQVNTETHDVFARGNITLQRADGSLWRGQQLTFNFKTGVGDFGEFLFTQGPFRIRGKSSESLGKNHIRVRGVTVTTCDDEHREYVIRATSAEIIDQHYLWLYNPVLFVGRVPVFYWPAQRKNLRGDGQWDFLPGYSSRAGAFLLTAFTQRFSPTTKAVLHFDGRTRRGLAGGADLVWNDPAQSAKGFIRGYYADDRKPIRNEREQAEREGQIEAERYRLRLNHAQTLSPRDSLYAEMNYLSDPWVIEDFFRREYREELVEPENRVALTHRGDQFSAGLLLSKRLNDFYGQVERLPEGYLDVPRLKLGDSSIYYESRNRFSSLTRVFPDAADRDSYDAVRLDSAHRFFYPTRQFGFLSVVPRAGLRGTYYSATRAVETVTNLVTQTGSNGVTTVSNQVTQVSRDTGADLRVLTEIGVETSFKAYRTFTEDDIGFGRGLRHVVEPYLDYALVPEPNLRPADLYPFDDVDALDKRHTLTPGVRNQLQTKRGDAVHPLVDADLHTEYRLDPEEEQNDFGPAVFDVELRPTRVFRMDFDGQYDFQGDGLETFNTQLSLLARDDSRLSLDYQYRRNQRNLWATELALFPSRRWSFEVYHRFEAETSRLEEHSYFVRWTRRCLAWGAGVQLQPGYDGQDDEVDFWVTVNVLALPKSALPFGG